MFYKIQRKNTFSHNILQLKKPNLQHSLNHLQHYKGILWEKAGRTQAQVQPEEERVGLAAGHCEGSSVVYHSFCFPSTISNMRSSTPRVWSRR